MLIACRSKLGIYYLEVYYVIKMRSNIQSDLHLRMWKFKMQNSGWSWMQAVCIHCHYGYLFYSSL